LLLHAILLKIIHSFSYVVHKFEVENMVENGLPVIILYVYICIYTHIHMCVCVCVY